MLKINDAYVRVSLKEIPNLKHIIQDTHAIKQIMLCIACIYTFKRVTAIKVGDN